MLSQNYLLCLNFCFIKQEHLFIVCELLKANLYEFQKFSRESGGEAYFTLKRLQVCLTMLSLPLYVLIVSVVLIVRNLECLCVAVIYLSRSDLF